MSGFTAFAVYFIIWWVTLFLVLPIGVRSQAEAGHVEPGTDPGAPVKSHIAIKMAVNTVISAIVFGVWWYLTYRLGIGLEDILPVPQPRLG